MNEDAKGAATSPSVPHGAVLVGALGVGTLGDVLLRASGGAGLDLLVLFVRLAVATGFVVRQAGLGLSLEALSWISLGLVSAMAIVIRASPALRTFPFLAASAFPALGAGRSWFCRSGVSDLIEAMGGAMVHAGLGPLRMSAGGGPGRVGSKKGLA